MALWAIGIPPHVTEFSLYSILESLSVKCQNKLAFHVLRSVVGNVPNGRDAPRPVLAAHHPLTRTIFAGWLDLFEVVGREESYAGVS
jgi:hypothetical protein